MAVTSTTLAGVNVWQFSGAVTDAQIKTAWAGVIVNGVYVINRAIYLDSTADMSAVTGGLLVDFGTQVDPGFILHTGRDKTKSTFKNFTFLSRTGLSVPNRGNLVKTWDGSIFIATAANGDGISQDGGGFVYGVPGAGTGGDPRFLLELPFLDISNVTAYSQEFTEQELQILVNQSKVLKGLIFEKCYGFPQIGTPIGSTAVVVYRSTMNTQSDSGGGLIPIRLLPTPAGSGRYASVCYVDSYLTRNSADINTRLIDTFSSSAVNRSHITILNNYTRGTWFGTTKTNFPPASNWVATNTIYGGVLKKLQFIGGNGGVVKAYDSRSTTVAQRCKFEESGFVDFLNTDLAPTTDSEGKIQLTHIGAIATGSTLAIVRYTGQKYTFQKFGYKVYVATPDMTSGDNDLSAFTPIIISEQLGISRTQAAITAATTITNFQELLEELHVLAIGLSGSQSYNGYKNGNLFDFTGTELKTNFTTVNVDATAASKIAYNSATNTLTIKASNLVGNEIVNSWNNSIGAINLLNGATIQGVYTTSAGTSTALEINPPSDDYSLCVFKANGTTKYFASDVNAGSYYVYFAPNEAGTYFLAAEKYGQKRTEDTLVLNGGNVWYNITDQEDVGITDNFATASAYTTLSTTSEIYDATAVFRLSETGIKLGQLVARDGLYLDFGNYNVKIKDDASAIVAVASGVITYKSIVINESLKYNAMKATPPKTITPTDTEIINVLIEDANGDSQLSILGGDNLGYELWKVTTATATDDYATGTLLTTLATNAAPYRFIGISGFDIVGRDVSSGVRRRSSMLKGTYTQAFYVGDQIQLATNAPQLIENNEKLSEVILKLDTNLDVAVSTRLADADYIDPATPQNVLDAKTEVLEAISEIPTTDISGLALEATSQEIKAKTDKMEFNASNHIAANVHQLQSSAITSIQNGLSLEATSQDILTAVNNIDVDFTPVLDAVATKPTLSEMEASSVLANKTDITNAQTDIEAKIDAIPETDLTGIATATDVTNAQISIEEKIDNIVVDNEAISQQVWQDQPERLKQVATVETTGEQLESFNNV
jgi:hypothetical protein